MEIQKHKNQFQSTSSGKDEENSKRQSCYRWVILILMGLALLLNGLMNNAITPLEHKMTLLYEVSETKVTFSVVVSFLVFFPASFPVIKILDSKGLRTAVICGTSLYFIGNLFYSLINKSYDFVLVGTLFIGIGQPFLLNSLFKVPAYWFSRKKRTAITSILIGCSCLGLLLGYLIPSLIIEGEDQQEQAKNLLGQLYLGYFSISGVILVLCLLLMSSRPQISPSDKPISRSYSFREAFYLIKNNKNLWMFLSGCVLGQGTLICFAVNLNFILNIYGYDNIETSILGTVMISMGILGAALSIIYIRKNQKYKIALGVVCLGSALLLTLLCFWINSLNGKIVTIFLLSIISLVAAPIIPICYDLCCQLTFPMGQTLSTVILNGIALLQTFFLSIFVTSVFSFQSNDSVMLILGFFSILLIFSALFFMMVKIDLKRKQYQKEQNQSIEFPLQSQNKREQETEKYPHHYSTQDQELQSKRSQYKTFVQEKEDSGFGQKERKKDVI